jgi:hypothetical protein
MVMSFRRRARGSRRFGRSVLDSPAAEPPRDEINGQNAPRRQLTQHWRKSLPFKGDIDREKREILSPKRLMFGNPKIFQILLAVRSMIGYRIPHMQSVFSAHA